jgi:hypothetical protein
VVRIVSIVCFGACCCPVLILSGATEYSRRVSGTVRTDCARWLSIAALYSRGGYISQKLSSYRVS